jgi:dihydrodipicolinate synthase/N-acetylneuraminate lyase
MLARGVYPASTTPFDAEGRVDMAGVAKLLAYFEACGCKGAVLAGTNGEGPSLSAVEKRDLIRAAMPLRGTLDLILGIATPSLDEAKWLVSQAGKAGAAAVLVMAPGYYRRASAAGIEAWFLSVLDSAALPVLVYRHPDLTGIDYEPAMIARLAAHPSFGGFKDSSGPHLWREFKEAIGDKPMFAGDERHVVAAMDAGWSGTISGCANVIPQWLAAVVREHGTESGAAKFELIGPVLDKLRTSPQPETNKAIQAAWGLIGSGAPRLPLVSAEAGEAMALIEATLGIRAGNLGIPGA